MDDKEKQELLAAKLGNYSDDVRDISKLLEFLPDDEQARKGFIDAVALKLLVL